MDLFVVAATFLFVVGTLFLDFLLAMLVAWYISNVQFFKLQLTGISISGELPINSVARSRNLY